MTVKHLSLFSGIESFKKAMDNLGLENELVGYSEIDKWASTALTAIHEVEENLNYGDITKIDETKLPDCDLITYGFPCQDISVAGLGKGIVKGETRSGLLHDALRIIKYKKPKYAIAENVKNLVGKRFKKDFNSLLEELESYGYNNYWKVLNAKDYGIPQNRERVFIVSIRKDVDDGKFEFPKPFDNRLRLRLKDLLEDGVEDKYYTAQRLEPNSQGITNRLTTVQKDNYVIEPSNLKHTELPCIYDDRDKGFGTKTSDVCPTQRANRHGIKCIETDYRIRKLTPKECWRLMGFADEDYFKARQALEDRFYNGRDRSNSQMYKMAGNSIVVDVLEAIFKELFI